MEDWAEIRRLHLSEGVGSGRSCVSWGLAERGAAGVGCAGAAEVFAGAAR